MLSVRARGVATCVVMGFCAVSAVQASSYLIATCTKDGAWGFQPVDTLLVNGKEMVRGVALSREPAAEWDAKSIGRQQQFRLTDFSI